MPRRTQNKAPKDTNAPKRPLSSYMIFSKQRSAVLRAEPANQGKKVTEITKMVGAEWKAMTQEQKQPFELEAKEKKKEYNRAMEEYKQSESFATFQTKLKNWKISQNEKAATQDDDEDERPAVRAKVMKRPKDTNAPKKPMTAFFLFQTNRRPQLKDANPDKKHTELVKLMSEEWNAMTAEQKEPYQGQAAVKKAAYDEQMAAYKESENYKKHQAAVAAWKVNKNAPEKQAKKVKKAAPPEPEPEPESKSSHSDSDRVSDSYDSSASSSENERKWARKAPRRTFSKLSSESESDDSESDVEMENRDSGAATGSGDESDESDESDGSDTVTGSD